MSSSKIPCEHKWVHLRDDGTEEAGYRKWNKVDHFFCEKCLEQKRVSVPVQEKTHYGAW